SKKLVLSFALLFFRMSNFFFFQAEDGIRDRNVTGVQTCALPISGFHGAVSAGVGPGSSVYIAGAGPVGTAAAVGAQLLGASMVRSEERRVGKEWCYWGG